MAGEQSIQLINALAFARGTSEPTNRGVWWIDESITGNIYDKVKYFNTDSGEWELVQRSALQILEDLRGVDGEGSGLDADTLQGYTPAQLMSGGGGSVPALSTGELLVGQGDTIGTAQTISGIATINTTGVLSYVNGSISHTGLSDIGTNTHAQIDAKLASIDNIEGNLTNIGTLGAGQDGQALTWDNATSRFVMASPSGQNFANTDLTLTGQRSHDLGANQLRLTSSNSASGVVVGPSGTGTAISTMTIRNLNGAKTNVLSILKQNTNGLAQFREDGFIFNSASAVKIGSEFFSLWGQTAVKGADTLPTSTAFEIYDGDTTPSQLWDFRNNGDLYTGKSIQTIYGANTAKILGLGEIWTGAATNGLIQFQNTGANTDILANYTSSSVNSGGKKFVIGTASGNYPTVGGGSHLILSTSVVYSSTANRIWIQGSSREILFQANGRTYCKFDENGEMYINPPSTAGVSIGGTNPDNSAKLDVSSTTMGFLPPRMTTTQRDAISTPATGLMVYNTTTNKLNFYNGTTWEEVTSA